MNRAPLARLGALAAAMLALGATAAPAWGADATFEGESMTLAPGASGLDTFDAAADLPSRRTLALWNNGAATKPVSVPQSTTHLLVRVRGEDCQGAPNVLIKIDGAERYSGPVSTSGYRGVGFRLSIPAGSHTVSINMTNDHSLFVGAQKICDRNVYVDHVRVVGQPFASTGWRNAPLSDDAPLAPNSAALAGDVQWQLTHPVARANGTFAPDVWVTTTEGYSVPVYVVNKDQPTVAVAPRARTLGGQPAYMGDQWDAVPLPPDAQPSTGEGALVVWQPETNTLWEFFELEKDALGRWSAEFGGRMQNVSSHEGQYENPPGRGYGASATSISLLAGLPRIEELKRGVIDHAIDFAVMNSKGRDGWCWPAHRTDPGHTRTDSAAIPGGARFRLRASFDLEAWASTHSMHPYGLMVARAIQRYGMVARDQGEGFGFWAEDPAPTGSDPYWGSGGLFGGANPNGAGVFRDFPWHELQALAQPSDPDKGCEDDPDVD
ncbi:MAG TPA: carbohydrate-binding domain-containing protein [Thermoleophilaceae bacterium]